MLPTNPLELVAMWRTLRAEVLEHKREIRRRRELLSTAAARLEALEREAGRRGISILETPSPITRQAQE